MKKLKLSSIPKVELTNKDSVIGLATGNNIGKALIPSLNKNVSGVLSIGQYPVNEIHKSFDAGMCFFIVPLSLDNLPDPNGGNLIHLQRLSRVDVSSSQGVQQLYFSFTGNIYYRVGRGNGSEVVFGNWRKISLV